MLITFDEDPGLRIESFAIIKLRGVTTKFKNIFFHHANFQRTKHRLLWAGIPQQYKLWPRNVQMSDENSNSALILKRDLQ